MPDQENFFDLDKQALGLVPIHIAFWEGFIYVNFAEQPHLTLDEQLGGLKEQLAGYPFDSYSTIFGYEGEVACNGKLSVDSQVEGNNAATIHRRTLGHSHDAAEIDSGTWREKE